MGVRGAKPPSLEIEPQRKLHKHGWLHCVLTEPKEVELQLLLAEQKNTRLKEIADRRLEPQLPVVGLGNTLKMFRSSL